MVTLQVKVVKVSILFMVLIFEKFVKANFTSTNDELDFREVIAINSQYPPMHDMCPLRILGGSLVDIEEVPYQILIVKTDKKGDFWQLVCGGSIITQEHVLSAAHCFQIEGVKKYYRVVAGTCQSNMVWYQNHRRSGQKRKSTNTEVWRKILSYFIHEHYSRATHNHDFAVLKLEFPVNFSRAVRPIPMLKPSDGIQIKDNDNCMVTGFGLTQRSTPSRHLRMVCVPYITRTRCNDIYGNGIVTANQFCAGDWGKDSCEGDSGGPITYHGYLIGIVSGGKCGHTPGIYTMISAYMTGDKIPLALSHGVMLSLNMLRIVFLVFLISVLT